ncbi:hypothetical protein GTQ34_05010 [Muricauda sp. JGD-17]|uniref:Tail specific protease domain-containing protein n=1 Tax=Flagellimonas ochracea TaxID=2696472 RepID=A0A964TAI9_9FLAO|nr:S41 family peptidase [Allomuricauda ochracea]NAY91273.1 hypothetical protein [Allomuricauda ochracea]
MKLGYKNYLVVCLIMVFAHLPSADGQNAILSKVHVNTVVEKTGELFNKNYVFPEKGKEVKQYLAQRQQEGVYDRFEAIDSLTDQLRKDILFITNDKHVNFIVKKQIEGKRDTPENPMTDFFKNLENFGLTKVEVLEGNIGLLEITFFFPINMNKGAALAAAKAMEKLQDCKAIIFDVRNCKGGDPEMLNYLVTYLYPENQKIHLNTFYFRPMDQYDQTYTLDKVPGKRMPNTPVYVLTGSTTFSCGEEFAYDIKHLKRGTLVGELTGGAAHPVQPMEVNKEIQVLIPVGRAINPITGTNWEGIGVKPHFEVSADEALDRVMALINEK